MLEMGCPRHPRDSWTQDALDHGRQVKDRDRVPSLAVHKECLFERRLPSGHVGTRPQTIDQDGEFCAVVGIIVPPPHDHSLPRPVYRC